MTTAITLFLGGLVILILGADFLLRGAARLAAAFGISPLVIGLTVVALGTASPEIAVSLQAAINGQGDLTLGNVLGSNIFNILFILGITALAAPIVIAEQLIRMDAPIMLAGSLLVLALALDGNLGLFDSLVLLSCLIAYIIFALRQSRVESKKVQNEYAEEFAEKQPRTAKNMVINILFILVGLGLLVVGSRWLVDTAVAIARALKVSELIIGLTIVAVGTSLPEVTTSLIAALKRESDIAVGNAVGSNIFNLLGVLGVGALLAPDGISVAARVLQLDFLVMIFVAAVSLPIFYLDNRISRAEGFLLLMYYIFYMAYIILQATNSSALPAVGGFIVFFVPITFIALLVFAIKSSRSRRQT
ncbi:MAG TPA: calcium/sodium antiporter [Anaerolineales bacterium]|nr:calcium/sodium antiporter [Anaerolineales bacterium]